MNLIKKLNWLHPLNIAANIPKTEQSWALLYSGLQTPHSGRYSILALDKQEEVSETFSALENKLSCHDNKLDNAWFGYFGYGLKNALEKLTVDAPSYINSPDLFFARYGTILVFDHEENCVEVWGENENVDRLSCIVYRYKEPTINDKLQVINVSSNMTREQYLAKVTTIKDAISRGDIYQANLTRKFFGEINADANPFNIFQKLCEISPAPYSAFIKNDDLSIISSSPERFLYIDKNGNVNTRPIKGSSARHPDKEGDIKAKAALAASEKDRAENLMIVDLSRNDLARNCVPGSIKVGELFGIETYSTVHHMVSSVSGIKNPDATTLELIKGCFPPGSMTGTPKIKAMEICSGLEKLKRGIYSGAIGWLGGDGSADLAVTIRTIIIKGNKFEFQVGGAIVNDSVAETEFLETMTKAKGVATALGISIEELGRL